MQLLPAVHRPVLAAAAAQDRKRAVREAMLAGPILATLLRLAWPTMTVLAVQTGVSVLQTFYLGFLGTDMLAAAALVFPVLMAMMMMSGGGIGGGVASAIARAIGARAGDDADALVLHALIIAVVLGAGFTAGVLWFGPSLFAALGGRGAALDAALLYSRVLFAGAVASWTLNPMSAALRGAGNPRFPALVTLCDAAVMIPLSPCLIFGLGPFPRLGIAGAGAAVTGYNVVAALAVLAYMVSGRGGVRLRRARLEARHFREILRIGLVSALSALQQNLTVVLITGAVGVFGVAALAGYGVASRLDYALLPLVFGLGTAVVTMVGTNIGAGQSERAVRIAWLGAVIAFSLTEAIGLAAARWPEPWLSLFDSNPAVLASGSAYLRVVGPFYGLYGLGTTLFFASQGAGRVAWPLIAGISRMLVAVIGGFALLHWSGRIDDVFSALAAALVIFGATNAGAVWAGVWFRHASPGLGATRASAAGSSANLSTVKATDEHQPKAAGRVA